MNTKKESVKRNPFRPGAGHMPPFLAGRSDEEKEFRRLLEQEIVTDNMILTGLRGVGKTVLLESFKPIAQASGWVWVGNDLSESSSISEDTLAMRLIADLALITTSLPFATEEISTPVFSEPTKTLEHKLDYRTLQTLYENTLGLPVDKLSALFERIWSGLSKTGKRGIVFAYDEAQTMSDHKEREEYPLATMLQVFQSAQRKEIPFLLVLAGLPTLLARLVESRTYAERMFHVVFLDRLNEKDSREAILQPMKKADFEFTEESVELVVKYSGGYPYFIQFVCREVYDLFISGIESVPISEILGKLDADFFAGRWQKLSDRQRELLIVAAYLPNCAHEFTVQEISDLSKKMLQKRFNSSNANQMLSSLCDKGLIFKNRHGKYSFAVPLLYRFIQRQVDDE